MTRKTIVFSALLIGFATMATAACTRVGLGIANLPVHFSNALSDKDIAFGELPQQKLDIYYPANIENPPLIVFFFGGRWSHGDKSQFEFVADTFTKLGYAVAIPNYRLYPEVKFPAFVEDAALAVSYLQTNADALSFDAGKIYLMGHSSGAHIASLILADRHYLKDAGGSLEGIRAFAGLAGPYAFTPDEDDLRDMFGPPERYPLMQVPTFIDGSEPPTLLLWGKDDNLVGKINIDKLKAAINEKGGSVKVIIYPDVSHVSIIGALSWLQKGKAPVAQDVDQFFKAH